MWRYLKEAFWVRPELPVIGALPVNALAVLGFGIVGGAEHAVWLLGLGLETAYLYLLATNPRFQHLVSARALHQTRQDTERTRAEQLARLAPESRARAARLADRLARIEALPRPEESLDLMADSNHDALEKLGALHLRLLGAEHDLQTVQQGTDEAELLRQSAVLERELQTAGGVLSQALRDSKQATLTLTQRRLANGRRRAESLAEVRSDLARIEAQVELALEDASLEGRDPAVAGNLNLLNRILESNSALSQDFSLDWSPVDPGGMQPRARDQQANGQP